MSCKHQIIFIGLTFFTVSMVSTAEPYPNRDNELERLIYSNSPAEGDTNHHPERPERIPQWMAQLEALPEVNKRLLALLERDMLQSKNPESMGLVLYALAHKKDLTAEQLSRITTPMEALAISGQKKDRVEMQLICSGLHVLRNYPTPAHELLAQKFADNPDSIILLNAVETLAEIGGPSSVQIVERVVERRKQFAGTYKDLIRDRMIEANKKLLARMVDTQGMPKKLNAPPPSESIKSADTKPVPPIIEPVSTPWFALCGAIIAALGLLWLFLKKRK